LNENLAVLAEHLQDVEEDNGFRVQLVSMLGGTDHAAAYEAVLTSIPNAPLSIQVAGAQALANHMEGRALLIASADAGRLSPRLLLDPRVQNPLLVDLPAEHRAVFDRVTADVEPIDLVLQREIEARVADFQPAATSEEAGLEVFKQNCAVCHQARGAGGVIGPQLDGVGRRGALALTEKILAPNRNVTPGFETYTLRLNDGSTRTGMLRREEGETIVFADFAANEFTVPRADIAELISTGFSLMPASCSETIPETDFNDLLGYLLTLK
jgi:putative heme-binding domain-containing protein